MKSSADFPKICSRIGMLNSPIRDVDDLSRVFIIALESGYKVHNETGIMIGYDFDCDSSKGCSGQYRSMDGSTVINEIISEFLSKQGMTFEPILGNEAVVIAQGRIKDAKLTSIKATAAVCATEEIDAKKIKCGITFLDLKTYGFDSALCIEETCVNKGVEV